MFWTVDMGPSWWGVLRKISEDMRLFFCQIISRPHRQHAPSEGYWNLRSTITKMVCVHTRRMSHAHLNDKGWDQACMLIFKVYPKLAKICSTSQHLYIHLMLSHLFLVVRTYYHMAPLQPEDLHLGNRCQDLPLFTFRFCFGIIWKLISPQVPSLLQNS